MKILFACQPGSHNFAVPYLNCIPHDRLQIQPFDARILSKNVLKEFGKRMGS